MKKWPILLAMMLLLGGCAIWKTAGGPYESSDLGVHVDLPYNWMRYNVDTGRMLIISRDGPLLQKIMIERVDIDNDLTHSKKKFSKNMLPEDVAQLYLDNQSSNKDITNLEVMENAPCDIAGNSGFRALYSYRTKDELDIKCLVYGFLRGENVYLISYTAPGRHYFDLDINTFDTLFKSFRLVKG